MLSLIITAVLTALSWLPDSFVQSFIASNIYGYAKIIPLLSYINYFFPIYILEGMLSVWVSLMIAVVVYYQITNITK